MFKDTHLFQSTANTFTANNKAYTLLTPGSKAYREFWQEERRRCKYGYEVHGVKITGYHYHYLNFCPILKSSIVKESSEEEGLNQAERIEGFPDFWDGDYEFFHHIEQAEENGKHAILGGSRGKGKEMPNYQMIKTFDGEKKLGEIIIGDIIIGKNGKPTKVLEVFPQGIKDVYELTLSDRRTVECGLEHLWEVITKSGKIKILQTKDLLDDYRLKHKKSGYTYKYALPINNEIEYEEKSLPIDPYILGCLIGDGSLTTSTPKISSIDNEIINEFTIRLPNYNIKRDIHSFNYTITYKDRFSNPSEYENTKFGINPLHREIVKLNLNRTCYTKFIPEIYKLSSIKQRYELIRGLLDTDGSISKSGEIEFSNSSEKLIGDLADVLRSLGISCKKYIKGKSSSRLYIYTNKEVFKLSRKKERISKEKGWNKVSIINIEKKGAVEQTCIMVDNDDKLFLTKDFIVTHNSLKSASMCVRNYHHIRKSKSYCFAAKEEYLLKDGIISKAWELMSFIDQMTPWGKRRQEHNTILHRKSSTKIKNDFGIETIDPRSWGSEIIGVTTGDNINKLRGKRGKLIILEEGGSYPNLNKGWNILRPSMEDGTSVFGLILAIGTGGEEGSNFQGFEELFINPKAYNIQPVQNIWDEGLEHTECGFFFPSDKNYTGAMDKDGNSNMPKARRIIEEDFKKVAQGNDPHALTRRKAELALCPRDMMMRISGTQFPIAELKKQEAEIVSKPHLYKDADFIGRFELNTQKQSYEFKFDSDVTPIYQFPNRDNKNLPGAIVLYSHPVKDNNGEVIKNRYFAGIDSYDFNESTTTSLGSCFIGDLWTRRIVAEYTGRPKTAQDFYEGCRRLLLYYSASAMIENGNKGIFDYFDNKNSGYLIADEPRVAKETLDDITLRRNTTRRTRGFTPSLQINSYARGLYAKWMMESTNNQELPEEIQLHRFRCLPAIKEAILWNSDGNYDRVSAMGALMLIFNDREKYNQETIEDHKSLAQDDFWKRNYKRKNNSNYNITNGR